MIGRRICYLAGVACSFVFFCFYKEWFSWLLMIGLLWLPVVSLLISLPAICTARVRIQAPEQVRSGLPARASLVLEGPFPPPPMKCVLALENKLNKERFTGSPGELIPTEHCGLVEMSCRKLWFYDYLGLWRFSRQAQVQSQVLVWPRAMPERHIPSPEELPVRAWKPKPGGGLAENYDLRLYRPGDELRQIHWKASAKVGKWIYKEALEPVQKQVILSLSLSGAPEELDRKLGRLLGISIQLLERGVPHRVMTQTGAGLLEHEVVDRKTQEQAVTEILNGVPGEEERHIDHPDALWLCRIGGGPDEA